MRPRTKPGGIAPVKGFFWSHPEWWCLLVSLLAWALLLGHAGLPAWWDGDPSPAEPASEGRVTRAAASGTSGLHPEETRGTPRSPQPTGSAPASSANAHHGPHAHHGPAAFWDEWRGWMLMVLAMMLPLVVHPLRIAAFRSFESRRHRAMTWFLMGYLAPWALLGLGAAPIRGLPWAQGPGVAAGAFAMAGLWVLTPWRRRAATNCHRTLPLAPSGWRADRDCLRFGSAVGIPCVQSCWLWMLACVLTGHSLTAMAGGFLLEWRERRCFWPSFTPTSLGTLAFAAYYAVRGWP